jgi:Ca-activated chloride channel family protein
MNLEFAWSWVFVALPLPWLAARLLPRAPLAAGRALRLPFYGQIALAAKHVDSSSRRWRLLLAVLAWLLLVFAAGRPQYLGEPIPIPLVGRELMLAVDISGSMAAEDMILGNRMTDRLTAVKAVAGDFIERRAGDRLGLILFARNAYVQTPLTHDRATVKTLLYEAAIGLAGKETAIGDAIGLAIKRLRERQAGNRVLVLLTDGANTTGAVTPLKAAALAAKEGVRIYTIGIGADPARSFFGSAMRGSALDESTLKAIAAETGGRYFRARDIRDLRQVYSLLDQLEPVQGDAEYFRPVDELYAWPLAAALGLSALLALTRLASSLPKRLDKGVSRA